MLEGRDRMLEGVRGSRLSCERVEKRCDRVKAARSCVGERWCARVQRRCERVWDDVTGFGRQ